jgi:hypothetical protein
VIPALVLFEEPLQTNGRVSHLEIAAPPDFMGNILGDIPRPPFRRVETNDPHGAVVLAVEKVGNDRLKVGCLDIGFAPAASVMTKIIDNQID